MLNHPSHSSGSSYGTTYGSSYGTSYGTSSGTSYGTSYGSSYGTSYGTSSGSKLQIQLRLQLRLRLWQMHTLHYAADAALGCTRCTHCTSEELRHFQSRHDLRVATSHDFRVTRSWREDRREHSCPSPITSFSPPSSQ